MTNDEIDALPSRELDAAVDRVVCDGKYFIDVSGVVATRFVSESESKSSNPWNWRMPVPHYSTDDGEAVRLLLLTGSRFAVTPQVAGWFAISIGCDAHAESVGFAVAACRAFLKLKSGDAAR